MTASASKDGITYLDEKKGIYREKMDIDSSEYTCLMNKVKSTCIDPFFEDRFWRVDKVELVKNIALEKRYEEKRAIMATKGLTEAEAREVLVLFGVSAKLCDDICKKGHKTGLKKRPVLGHTGQGIHLVQHYDILTRYLAFLQFRSSALIVVYKAILGKAKKVTIWSGKNNDPAIPDKAFTCFIPAKPVEPQMNITEAIESSYVYLYELDEASVPVRCPKQILPYAVIALERKPRVTLSTPMLAVDSGLSELRWEVKGETRRGFRWSIAKKPASRQSLKEKVDQVRRRRSQSKEENEKHMRDTDDCPPVLNRFDRDLTSKDIKNIDEPPVLNKQTKLNRITREIDAKKDRIHQIQQHREHRAIVSGLSDDAHTDSFCEKNIVNLSTELGGTEMFAVCDDVTKQFTVDRQAYRDSNHCASTESWRTDAFEKDKSNKMVDDSLQNDFLRNGEHGCLELYHESSYTQADKNRKLISYRPVLGNLPSYLKPHINLERIDSSHTTSRNWLNFQFGQGVKRRSKPSRKNQNNMAIKVQNKFTHPAVQQETGHKECISAGLENGRVCQNIPNKKDRVSGTKYSLLSQIDSGKNRHIGLGFKSTGVETAAFCFNSKHAYENNRHTLYEDLQSFRHTETPIEKDDTSYHRLCRSQKAGNGSSHLKEWTKSDSERRNCQSEMPTVFYENGKEGANKSGESLKSGTEFCDLKKCRLSGTSTSTKLSNKQACVKHDSISNTSAGRQSSIASNVLQPRSDENRNFDVSDMFNVESQNNSKLSEIRKGGEIAKLSAESFEKGNKETIQENRDKTTLPYSTNKEYRKESEFTRYQRDLLFKTKCQNVTQVNDTHFKKRSTSSQKKTSSASKGSLILEQLQGLHQNKKSFDITVISKRNGMATSHSLSNKNILREEYKTRQNGQTDNGREINSLDKSIGCSGVVQNEYMAMLQLKRANSDTTGAKITSSQTNTTDHEPETVEVHGNKTKCVDMIQDGMVEQPSETQLGSSSLMCNGCPDLRINKSKEIKSLMADKMDASEDTNGFLDSYTAPKDIPKSPVVTKLYKNSEFAHEAFVSQSTSFERHTFMCSAKDPESNSHASTTKDPCLANIEATTSHTQSTDLPLSSMLIDRPPVENYKASVKDNENNAKLLSCLQTDSTKMKNKNSSVSFNYRHTSELEKTRPIQEKNSFIEDQNSLELEKEKCLQLRKTLSSNLGTEREYISAIPKLVSKSFNVIAANEQRKTNCKLSFEAEKRSTDKQFRSKHKKAGQFNNLPISENEIHLNNADPKQKATGVQELSPNASVYDIQSNANTARPPAPRTQPTETAGKATVIDSATARKLQHILKKSINFAQKQKHLTKELQKKQNKQTHTACVNTKSPRSLLPKECSDGNERKFKCNQSKGFNNGELISTVISDKFNITEKQSMEEATYCPSDTSTQESALVTCTPGGHNRHLLRRSDSEETVIGGLPESDKISVTEMIETLRPPFDDSTIIDGKLAERRNAFDPNNALDFSVSKGTELSEICQLQTNELNDVAHLSSFKEHSGDVIDKLHDNNRTTKAEDKSLVPLETASKHLLGIDSMESHKLKQTVEKNLTHGIANATNSIPTSQVWDSTVIIKNEAPIVIEETQSEISKTLHQLSEVLQEISRMSDSCESNAPNVKQIRQTGLTSVSSGKERRSRFQKLGRSKVHFQKTTNKNFPPKHFFTDANSDQKGGDNPSFGKLKRGCEQMHETSNKTGSLIRTNPGFAETKIVLKESSQPSNRFSDVNDAEDIQVIQDHYDPIHSVYSKTCFANDDDKKEDSVACTDCNTAIVRCKATGDFDIELNDGYTNQTKRKSIFESMQQADLNSVKTSLMPNWQANIDFKDTVSKDILSSDYKSKLFTTEKTVLQKESLDKAVLLFQSENLGNTHSDDFNSNVSVNTIKTEPIDCEFEMDTVRLCKGNDVCTHILCGNTVLGISHSKFGSKSYDGAINCSKSSSSCNVPYLQPDISVQELSVQQRKAENETSKCNSALLTSGLNHVVQEEIITDIQDDHKNLSDRDDTSKSDEERGLSKMNAPHRLSENKNGYVQIGSFSQEVTDIPPGELKHNNVIFAQNNQCANQVERVESAAADGWVHALECDSDDTAAKTHDILNSETYSNNHGAKGSELPVVFDWKDESDITLIETFGNPYVKAFVNQNVSIAQSSSEEMKKCEEGIPSEDTSSNEQVSADKMNTDTLGSQEVKQTESRNKIRPKGRRFIAEKGRLNKGGKFTSGIRKLKALKRKSQKSVKQLPTSAQQARVLPVSGPNRLLTSNSIDSLTPAKDALTDSSGEDIDLSINEFIRSGSAGSDKQSLPAEGQVFSDSVNTDTLGSHGVKQTETKNNIKPKTMRFNAEKGRLNKGGKFISGIQKSKALKRKSQKPVKQKSNSAQQVSVSPVSEPNGLLISNSIDSVTPAKDTLSDSSGENFVQSVNEFIRSGRAESDKQNLHAEGPQADNSTAGKSSQREKDYMNVSAKKHEYAQTSYPRPKRSSSSTSRENDRKRKCHSTNDREKSETIKNSKMKNITNEKESSSIISFEKLMQIKFRNRNRWRLRFNSKYEGRMRRYRHSSRNTRDLNLQLDESYSAKSRTAVLKSSESDNNRWHKNKSRGLSNGARNSGKRPVEDSYGDFDAFKYTTPIMQHAETPKKHLNAWQRRYPQQNEREKGLESGGVLFSKLNAAPRRVLTEQERTAERRMAKREIEEAVRHFRKTYEGTWEDFTADAKVANFLESISNRLELIQSKRNKTIEDRVTDLTTNKRSSDMGRNRRQEFLLENHKYIESEKSRSNLQPTVSLDTSAHVGSLLKEIVKEQFVKNVETVTSQVTKELAQRYLGMIGYETNSVSERPVLNNGNRRINDSQCTPNNKTISKKMENQFRSANLNNSQAETAYMSQQISPQNSTFSIDSAQSIPIQYLAAQDGGRIQGIRKNEAVAAYRQQHNQGSFRSKRKRRRRSFRRKLLNGGKSINKTFCDKNVHCFRSQNKLSRCCHLDYDSNRRRSFNAGGSDSEYNPELERLRDSSPRNADRRSDDQTYSGRQNTVEDRQRSRSITDFSHNEDRILSNLSDEGYLSNSKAPHGNENDSLIQCNCRNLQYHMKPSSSDKSFYSDNIDNRKKGSASKEIEGTEEDSRENHECLNLNHSCKMNESSYSKNDHHNMVVGCLHCAEDEKRPQSDQYDYSDQKYCTENRRKYKNKRNNIWYRKYDNNRFWPPQCSLKHDNFRTCPQNKGNFRKFDRNYQSYRSYQKKGQC